MSGLTRQRTYQEGSCRYWSSIFAVATIPVYEELLKVFSERKADREVPGAHFVRPLLCLGLLPVVLS